MIDQARVPEPHEPERDAQPATAEPIEQLDSAEDIARVASARTPFSTKGKLDLARELVRTLAVAQYNSTLYPDTHPTVAQAAAELVRAVSEVLDIGLDDVTLSVYKTTLFVENHVMPEESVTYRKLIEEMRARGIPALRLARDFDGSDATLVVRLLNASDVTDKDSAEEFLVKAGATGVSVTELTVVDEAAEAGQEDPEIKAAARSAYDAGIAAIRDVETRVKLGKVFEVDQLQLTVASLLDVLFRDSAAVLALTAIKSHDDYTLNHSINVCIIAIAMGATLGLERETLKSLGLSALLYDLGKVRVPGDILNKEGPLTNDEWRIVKSHTIEGADILRRIQLVDSMPMIVAYEHHLRHDLQGYPEDTDTREQHLFSRVVALSDAYDAMTTRRPFRREIRPDKALAVLMQGRGKAYDPALTKALVAMVGIYPIGAVVRLSDSSTGVVFRINTDDLLRPRVKVLIDAEGRHVEDPFVVDLRLVPEDGRTLGIIECLPSADAGIDDVWEYL